MSQNSKKYDIKWVDGTDNKGNAVKYRSLVECEPKKEDNIETSVKFECYHEWQEYRGFLIAEKTCLKCKTVIKLST